MQHGVAKGNISENEKFVGVTRGIQRIGARMSVGAQHAYKLIAPYMHLCPNVIVEYVRSTPDNRTPARDNHI